MELMNCCNFIYKYYHLKVGCLHPVACTRSGTGLPSNATLNILFSNRYMFRSYDHLQAEIYIYIYIHIHVLFHFVFYVSDEFLFMLCLFVFICCFSLFFTCSRFINDSILWATVCRMYCSCFVSNWFIAVSASSASVLIQLLCLWCRFILVPCWAVVFLGVWMWCWLGFLFFYRRCWLYVVSFSCSFFSLCSFFVIFMYLCFIVLFIVFVVSFVIIYIYLFIYLFTNCNWAYARWQCLHKMNEHK
jgi:hypothetical protein